MSSLKSPLIAILKSRRAREESAHNASVLTERSTNAMGGKDEARTEAKAKTATISRTNLTTPPDFTPRRRRLRKIGKDALRKFQQKKEAPVAQKLEYRDSSDDDEGDERDDNAPPPSNLDDVLEGLGGLGIGDDKPRTLAPKPRATAVVSNESSSSSDGDENVVDDDNDDDNDDDEEASGSSTDSPSDHALSLPGGFELRLSFPLYPHQREGIEWLWKLHRAKKGGVLADDMGLGKTMQISAFLSGLFRHKQAKRAVIVAPKTLLKHWVKELTKCGLGGLIFEFYGGDSAARVRDLERSLRRGGVVLTTYGMVLHNSAELKGLGKIKCIDTDDETEQVRWDYMVLDEGHKLKNPKIQVYQKLKSFVALHRIILTGTPVQNNMQELHALMEFVSEGILGDRRDFREDYERPIINGLDKAASHRDREIGKATSARLQSIISKYILRREKEKVFKKEEQKEGSDQEKAATETEGSDLPTLSDVRKNDLVVWLKLNQKQRNLYMSFLQTESVFKALNNTGSALAALSVLKKICDHTSLLTHNAANQISSQIKINLISDDEDDEDGEIRREEREMSCKIDFLLELLPELSAGGHRTLVFSQSRQMLDRIQSAVEDILGLRFCRIDGSISSIDKRQEEVDRFKKDTSVPLFLLTTGVGGLGLTLTEADRVVVVDPNWNPSTDNQSVDRAYRIGQRRNVVVYRLITCGTVEEKIYRKQVFKQGLSIISNGGEEAFRYFTKQELRELFSASYEGFERSKTQEELHRMHGKERKSDEALDRHLARVESLRGVLGTSDHDLLFTKAPEESTYLFQPPARKPAGNLKFSECRVPQSPLARKMQSRSQWEGAGLLSHLTINDRAEEKEVGPSASKGPSAVTVARVDCTNINAVVDNEEISSRALKEIQSLREGISRTENVLANITLVSRLPDGGEQLRQKKASLEEKLSALLSKSKGEPYASPTRSYEMYKEAYKAAKEAALEKERKDN